MTTQKTPVTQITMHHEKDPSDKTVTTAATFDDADAVIQKWAMLAPSTGGYDKIHITVQWADGTEYRLRMDLQHDSKSQNDLRTEILQSALFYSGRCQQLPSHVSPVRYEHMLTGYAPSLVQFYDHLLTNCDIGHVPDPLPQSIWKEAAQPTATRVARP